MTPTRAASYPATVRATPPERITATIGIGRTISAAAGRFGRIAMMRADFHARELETGDLRAARQFTRCPLFTLLAALAAVIADSTHGGACAPGWHLLQNDLTSASKP
jgi:hypothetical protein